MHKNIYIYWTGKEYKLIKILRELIYKHSNCGRNYNITLLNRDNVEEYVALPPYFDTLLPAHQADYVRVAMLYEHGGMWLDSDTLVMDDLSRLFDIFDKYDGFFIKENNKNIWNGVFSSKPKTKLLEIWLKFINNRLSSNKKLAWSEIGSNFLDRCDTKLYDSYKIFNGLENMYSVDYKISVKEFIKQPYDNYKNIEREFQPIVVLVNSVYKELELGTDSNKTSLIMVDGKYPETIPLNYFINKSKNVKY